MIKNFWMVTIRFFMRERMYAMVNVLGLAGALLSATLIFLWVQDELRTDAAHPDVDRIYRLMVNIDFGDKGLATWSNTPGRFGDDLRNQFSDRAYIVSLSQSQSLIQEGENVFRENGVYADPEIFRVISFPILQGDADSLTGKHSIAISSTLAGKLFGEENPIGRDIRVNGNRDVEVKAVFAIPSNTSVFFDFVMPLDIWKEFIGSSWSYGNFNERIFVKLHPGQSAENLTAQINATEDARAVETNDNPARIQYWLQPLKETYLHSQYKNGAPDGGRIEYVRTFSLIALVIVIVACINFTNLCTAKSTLRCREVGIRKVVGAGRASLAIQFMGESFLLSSLSLIAAVFLVFALLPFFNELTGKSIQLDLLETQLLTFLFAVTILSGLLGGAYPAVLLSSFKPVGILRGDTSGLLRGGSVRSSLVVLQFIVTFVLCASALVIFEQIQYVRNKNLGYDRSSTISFGGRTSLITKFEAFRQEASRLPGVTGISRADGNITNVQNHNNGVDWKGEPEGNNMFFRTIVAEYDFPRLMDLRVTEGRLFESLADTMKFLLNQRAVEVMGLTHPIGEEISQWGFKGKVIGVVDDFHVQSMHEAIDPVVILCAYGTWPRRVYVRLKPDQMETTLPQLETLVRKYSPESPFEFTFLDDDYNRLYKNEQVTASLATMFTSLTLVISGLGLLGLTAFTVERRKREIAIRKTLGASVAGLSGHISMVFSRHILVAIALGVPISYYLLETYLGNFAYRVSLDWTTFAWTVICVIAFSMSIVLSQVVKAALMNPSEVLKQE